MPDRVPFMWLVVAVLALAAQAIAADGGLSRIPRGEVVIDGRVHMAHIADDHRERGQGFQNVPAAQIRDAMIYFRFPRPQVPGFHMHNVAAPLAIAWIDSRHEVIAISIMQPGESGYRPPGPVIAALEVHPDRLKDLGIADGVTIRLPEDGGT